MMFPGLIPETKQSPWFGVFTQPSSFLSKAEEQMKQTLAMFSQDWQEQLEAKHPLFKRGRKELIRLHRFGYCSIKKTDQLIKGLPHYQIEALPTATMT